jgi:lipopolysaccharide/colanic/teichoic acid biosynthesis glycosyltransferase
MTKRIFDTITSLLLLVLLSPAILIIAILIAIQLGPPVLFRQQRPGLHAKPFYIVKFKTMLEAYDEDGKLLPDAQRMTPLGNFLRKTSLDELPELWNVIKGEMSLVGPRPLLMQYLSEYSTEQARRHDVLPGITGWAQVNGRNAIDWDKKFELDVWYVDNHSLFIDLKILFLTIKQVLLRKGISHEGYTTMPFFKRKD